MIRNETIKSVNDFMALLIACGYSLQAICEDFYYNNYYGFAAMASNEAKERYYYSCEVRNLIREYGFRPEFMPLTGPSSEYSSIANAIQAVHGMDEGIVSYGDTLIESAFDSKEFDCGYAIMAINRKMVAELDEVRRISSRVRNVEDNNCSLMSMDKAMYDKYSVKGKHYD